MENCGGGGQRLPPDGDEFPAAYQEFTNPNQPYQYVTKRESVAANGDVDRGESMLDGGTGFVQLEKQLILGKGPHASDTSLDAKSLELLEGDTESRTTVGGCLLYTGARRSYATASHASEKKLEIAGYYGKEAGPMAHELLDAEGAEGCPPPLPLTGPPSASDTQERKFAVNGELWRQDNKSEKSVKDKIAMFSLQSSLEAPLFPTTIAAAAAAANSSSCSRRLSKHKSSDDVFADERSSPATVERTQSSLDLSAVSESRGGQQKSRFNGYSNGGSPGYPRRASPERSKYPPADQPRNYVATYNGGGISPPLGGLNKSFEAAGPPTLKAHPNGLTRAMSFSGSPNPYNHDKPQASSEPLVGAATVSRTNSLASTFKRPSDDARKSSLNQLIEQRRKGISKLRGLVIPEKDSLPLDQPIIDLPEIKSRDSILNNQVSRTPYRHDISFSFVTFSSILALPYS
jgi:hypothetical protein